MPSTVSQLSAFAVAISRYATTVAPIVDREMARWRARAGQIPDPTLREHAETNLRDAAAHVQVAGLILTLAPRQHRARALVAAIAIEVAYDYLDSITEEQSADPLGDGLRLYQAFAFAFGGPTPTELLDDGGYLLALATACRLAFLTLPSAAVIAGEARRVADGCGEAQTRTHAIVQLGPGQLAAWADAHPIGDLAWWETAAGRCASVLVLHALIAAAGSPSTTAADARPLVAAYLRISVLTTLLDSLKDRDADRASGAHSFVGYYRTDKQLADALAYIALGAATISSATPHPVHNAMTVAGCAAFYCSAIDDPATGSLLAELQPVVSPILWMFKAWRASSRLRH